MTPQHFLPDESLERGWNFPHLSYSCVRCFTAQDGTTPVPILASRCVLTAAVPRHTLRKTPYSSSSQLNERGLEWLRSPLSGSRSCSPRLSSSSPVPSCTCSCRITKVIIAACPTRTKSCLSCAPPASSADSTSSHSPPTRT